MHAATVSKFPDSTATYFIPHATLVSVVVMCGGAVCAMCVMCRQRKQPDLRTQRTLTPTPHALLNTLPLPKHKQRLATGLCAIRVRGGVCYRSTGRRVPDVFVLARKAEGGRDDTGNYAQCQKNKRADNQWCGDNHFLQIYPTDNARRRR